MRVFNKLTITSGKDGFDRGFFPWCPLFLGKFCVSQIIFVEKVLIVGQRKISTARTETHKKGGPYWLL